MPSTIENNKLRIAKQRNLNSGQSISSGIEPTNANRALKKRQDNDNSREEEQAKRVKKRRSSKIALNDTFRRIRHLITEGHSNLEIQEILQLEERTFYRYMARIYEIDQALFDEQEKRTISTETGVLKDRWLKSYRWYNAIADNEQIKPDFRMEAQRKAVEIALALLKLELEGPNIVRQEGGVMEELYSNGS